jgi:hypothetical protein
MSATLTVERLRRWAVGALLPITTMCVPAMAAPAAAARAPIALVHSSGTRGGSGPAARERHRKVRTDVTAAVAARTIDETGEQRTIRQYDRRRYIPDIAELDLEDWGETHRFSFGFQDLLTPGWQRAWIGYQGNQVRASATTDGLTRRQQEYHQAWVIDGQLVVADPGTSPLPFSTTNPARNVIRRDLDKGFPFRWDRRVDEAALMFGSLMDHRLIIHRWSEHENGQRQIFIRDPFTTAFEHPTTSFEHPMDRTSRLTEAGYLGHAGEVPLRYTYFRQTLRDDTPDFFMFRYPDFALPTVDPATPGLPAFFRFPEFATDGHRFSFGAPLGDRAAFGLSLVTRDRDSAYTGNHLDIDTYAGHVRWSPGRHWDLVGAFNSYRRHTSRNFAYDPPSTEDAAIGVWDETRDTFTLESRWRGIRKHLVSAGVRTEDTSRPNAERTRRSLFRNREALSLDLIGDELLLVNTESARTGVWSRISGQPWNEVNYSARYETVSANRDVITRGMPGNTRDLSLELSIDVRPDLQLFASHDRWSGKGSATDLFERRHTFTAGVTGQVDRVAATAYYDHGRTDANFSAYMADARPEDGHVTRGTADTLQAVKQFLDVESRERTVGLDIAVPIRDRWDLSAAFTRTLAEGFQPLNILNNIATIGRFSLANRPFTLRGRTESAVNPIDTSIDRLMLAAEHRLDGKKGRDSVRLEHTYGQWKDGIDPLQTGRFNATSVFWRRRL